jgi:hypothetical protein
VSRYLTELSKTNCTGVLSNCLAGCQMCITCSDWSVHVRSKAVRDRLNVVLFSGHTIRRSSKVFLPNNKPNRIAWKAWMEAEKDEECSTSHTPTPLDEAWASHKNEINVYRDKLRVDDGQ